MKPYSRMQLVALLKDAINIIEKMPIKKSCSTCQNYDCSGLCKLVQKLIPAEIIEVGCEAYLFDMAAPPF